MTPSTKLSLVGLLFLCLQSFSTQAANIAIIESTSYHPHHNMDEKWASTFENLGHQADILSQNILNNLNFLEQYDALIISSGLIEISPEKADNIEAFLLSGRNVYIQSEFMNTFSTNVLFARIVNSNSGNFSWDGFSTGNIQPMEIISPYASVSSEENEISYFWYGSHGTGGPEVVPFLESNGLYFGFTFTPQQAGKLITTSDQDWLKEESSPYLLEQLAIDLAIVNALPEVSINLDNSPNCEGDYYIFEATIEHFSNSTILQWLVNGQEVRNESNVIFESNTLQDGDVVQARVSLSENTYEHISNPILIAPLEPLASPTVHIQNLQDSYCPNEHILLSVSGENWGENPTFNWSINGVWAEEFSGPHFSRAGLEEGDLIACTVGSSLNCVETSEASRDEVTIRITEFLLPTIQINPSATSYCENETILLEVQGENWGDNSSILWFVDEELAQDGGVIFESNQLQPENQIQAILEYSDDCFSNTEIYSNPISVDINEASVTSISIAATSSITCLGEEITIEARTENFDSTTIYTWYTNGEIISSSNNPILNTTINTQEIEIYCEANSQQSCITQNTIISNRLEFATLLESAPSIEISASSNIACDQESIRISSSVATPIEDALFQWYVNEQLQAENTPELLLENIGAPTQVYCILTIEGQCSPTLSTQSNTLNITKNEIIIQEIEKVNPTCGLKNGMLEIDVQGGQAPYTYAWSNGNMESFSSSLSSGTYTIEVSDANGCTVYFSTTLHEEAGLKINEIDSRSSSCGADNGSAWISVESTSENLSYKWLNELNVIISRNDTISNVRPGLYRVWVNTAEGCEIMDSIRIEKTSEIHASIEGKDRIQLGESLRLDIAIDSNLPVKIYWSDMAQDSCDNCFSRVLSPTQDTQYEVKIITQDGCEWTISKFVKVVPSTEVYIPNAFSPNNDGVNDHFTAFAGNEYVSKIKSMQIFNRWGAQVFKAHDIAVNNEGQGWNGKAGGLQLDTAVYIYQIEIEFVNGESQVFTGDVTLVN